MSETVDSDNTYSPLQQIKRHFFAMRNGIVADALRKGGCPFRYIFGLNLPQLVEASTMTGKNSSLAETLWRNSSTRESMLLAPMLMPEQDFKEQDAIRWISEVPSVEVGDILCHRLLRRLSFADDLVLEFSDAHHTDMERYVAGRLAMNLSALKVFDVRPVLFRLKENPGVLAAAIARQIEMYAM